MSRESIKMDTIMPVVDSWNMVKKLDPSWSENFGVLVFQKLLKASPLSLTLLLPFATDGEKILENDTQFKAVAAETAYMVDFIVSSLGTDMDIVKMQLEETFAAHENFKRVRPEHWTLMGKAMLEALGETLGDRFNSNMADCWAHACDSVSFIITEEIMAQ
mmetsp:Transcript_2891/g.6156  ORF Transcript_2891/g.6156 Transcript_2891/m.6156 type:complete len:161 (+) Transcript_2891:79-561(+)